MINSNIITYILIGTALVLSILIIILSITLCRVNKKNKIVKKTKKARKEKIREIKLINHEDVNAKSPLVDYYEKNYGLGNEEGNKNSVNYNPLNLQLYEKPIIDSSPRNPQINTVVIDKPPNAFVTNHLNRTLINNNNYSLQSNYNNQPTSINNGKFTVEDIEQPSLQVSQINDTNKNIESSEFKTAVITTSIPGNNTIGRDNVGIIPPIQDPDNLQENSFHSSRSNTSSSQHLLNQPSKIYPQEKLLDNQNLLNNNNGIEYIGAENSVSTQRNNMLTITENASTSIPVHNMNGINSATFSENMNNINNLGNEISTKNNNTKRTSARTINSYDYASNPHHSKTLNHNGINNSLDRNYLISNNNILRSASQKSANTTNTSMSRNKYPSLSGSHISTSHYEEESSVFTEGPSAISVENIAPSLKRSHKLSHSKKKAPEIQKVEVSISIDDIPNNVDINDEIEEDVFMRPSMMRFVEIEPSPILQLEAQPTRISYISNQSSPRILDQNLLSNSSDENSVSEEENEEKEKKTTTRNKGFGSPLANKEIIIENDDVKKNRESGSSLDEHLKDTIAAKKEDQTPNDNLKSEIKTSN